MLRSAIIIAMFGSLALTPSWAVTGQTTRNLQEQQDQVSYFAISLPLLLDDLYIGDVTVNVGDAFVSMSADRLIDLIGPDFTPEVVDSIRTQSKSGQINPDKIEISGMRFAYNPQMQQIEIQTLSNARQIKVLRIGSQNSRFKPETLEPADFSLFITPSLDFEYEWQKQGKRDRGFQPIRGRFD
ncbi:MAG: hypothetical protein HKN25_18345, partial [Pyrinomonadaceae bacterium]|nr:hypothetical protein [Pyrinomonadaceae bacterium]